MQYLTSASRAALLAAARAIESDHPEWADQLRYAARIRHLGARRQFLRHNGYMGAI